MLLNSEKTEDMSRKRPDGSFLEVGEGGGRSRRAEGEDGVTKAGLISDHDCRDHDDDDGGGEQSSLLAWMSLAR